MTYLNESEVSTLKDWQEKLMVMVIFFSACFSLVGSSLILFLFSKSNSKNAHRRILACMSAWDIIFTLQICFQPLLVPKETSQQVWAMGNDKSCATLGFLNQISFSAFFYNAALSFYYVLTIRGGMSEEKFSKRVEPWLHLFCNGYPTVTAIAGAVVGVYGENELGPGCWVNNYVSEVKEMVWCSMHVWQPSISAFSIVLIFLRCLLTCSSPKTVEQIQQKPGSHA